MRSIWVTDNCRIDKVNRNAWLSRLDKKDLDDPNVAYATG